MAESTSDFISSHDEMYQQIQNIAERKANGVIWKTLLLAIMAGIYIAFGGLFSTIAGTDAQKVFPYGVVRIIMGIVFSLGLILVVVGGAELFTGNTILSVLKIGKLNLRKISINWLIVYIGNLIGSILLAFMVFLSGQYLSGNGALGVTVLNIALTKVHYTFQAALTLGILANMLVCLALWLSFRTTSVIGKIFAIIFPISAFVAAGFEHSVANMYLIPVALFIKNLNPVYAAATSLTLTDLTWTNFFINNLIPVTIGNIIGGCFIWVIYNIVYRK